ncbi:Alanine racemase [Syntrophobotulus glycolicus DSM 8271]|uniref:Alanine racemase n=1 Tax=Syntrophobotulus glycolicus (strain DSM 8271 / FlGlyR) TaxID=645991 RepID=F0T2D2_SYNGF|nr:alanine racemase [Syntrophobotulus glycolicus]ADY57560.1 Alanine racemase [Syntrophobotulus glycolicus DSM 8271]
MSNLWIEVDLDAVVHNYWEIQKKLSPGTRCLAVVKADAYGLGAVAVAQALQEEGCREFAVTTVEEGAILRENGIEGMILVLGPTRPADWESAIRKELSLSLPEASWVPLLEEICAKHHAEINVHLKIETGMGRTGLMVGILPQLAGFLQTARFVKVEGAFTHFARAAQRDNAYTKRQYGKFLSACERLEGLGINIPIKHVCNSAAFLDFPEMHHEFVRVGTLLLGHLPSQFFAGSIELKDPWKAKARILYIREVPKGTFVGYQSLYRCKKDTRLAVISAGYTDGFGVEPRLVPQGLADLMKIIIKNIAAYGGIYLGREKLTLNGRPVKVAGKIGMQLTVLDIGAAECQAGDIVEVPLRRTNANPRIERYYINNKEYLLKRKVAEGFFQLNTEYPIVTTWDMKKPERE